MPAPKEIWLVTNSDGEICRGLMGGDAFISAQEAKTLAANLTELLDRDFIEMGERYSVHRYIRIRDIPSQLTKPPRGQIGQ